MPLSRKDYVAIANIIKNTNDNLGVTDAVETTISEITFNLASYFFASNPAFNREAFYSACGYFDGQDRGTL